MSEIHVQPITWTVRFYPDGGGFPGPFVGVATVQAMGTYAIYVSAISGTLTRKHIREMANFFTELGYKRVIMQRKGEIKYKMIADFF